MNSVNCLNRNNQPGLRLFLKVSLIVQQLMHLEVFCSNGGLVSGINSPPG